MRPLTTTMRCPSEHCGALFQIDTDRLGRSDSCPSCGVRLTARSLEIETLLQDQERRIRGGDGAGVDRLPLAVLVDNVRSLWNVGSIFRTADGCGVSSLVLTGITGCPPRKEITKTALGAEQAVAWRYRADPLQGLNGLIDEGFSPVALENSTRAVPVEAMDWPSRVCLVVGNEVAGVSRVVLDACERHVRVPMHGVKSSLNVAVAFGVAAYQAALTLRRRLKATLAIGTALLLPAIGLPQDGDSREMPAAKPSIELPTTLDRVWYRGGKKGGSGGKRRTGDLTVTLEGLEFRSAKGEVNLSLDSIRSVSIGRITGDVDTDWVMLAAGPPGATRIVSFRDGTKLGYGKRTEHIYAVIRDALRLARAGPYDVPDGFETYDRLARQFTLAVPRGWAAHHESSVQIDGELLWGRTVFSEHPPQPGAENAITLDRREALSGMTCNGFSKTAERKLVEWLEQDRLFGTDVSTIEGPVVEPFPLGDCIARRLRARVRDAAGAEIRIDARAVSDDRTVFFFILRSRPENHAQALARFDRSVASFEPAPTR